MHMQYLDTMSRTPVHICVYIYMHTYICIHVYIRNWQLRLYVVALVAAALYVGWYEPTQTHCCQASGVCNQYLIVYVS